MAPPVQLPSRPVGKNGRLATAVGFGAMGLSVGYGSVGTDEERLKLLDRAWELGCTNWDTADCYADSEDLFGKWFKLHPERRQDIFLATKFGLELTKPGDASSIRVNATPEYARQAIESSLRRLGVEYIDLYYLHRPQPDVPIEKTMEALKQFIEEGKIKAIGISEASSSTLRRAHAVHPISAIQVEYNPWDLDIEGEKGTYLKQACDELGIAIFAYSPLGRGIITGRYRSRDDFEPGDFRLYLARYSAENFPKNLALVDKFAEFAKRKGCTSSQLVLAWLVAQGDNVFVIPGTKSLKYLEENIGAAKVTVTEEEKDELRKMVTEADIAGDRTPNFGGFVDTVPL